jgi:hypothetical protein
MILLLCLFIVTLIKTWKNDISLFKSYAVIFLVWYVALNYINIDHIIAKQNVERYHKHPNTAVVSQKDYYSNYDRYGDTKYVDLSYLQQLSYDVVPQLMELRKEPELKPIIDKQLSAIKFRLEQDNKDWTSFNLSRYRAAQFLKNIE